MSDSDDTDILLLIPPNFFLVNDDFNDDPDRYSRLCYDDKFTYNQQPIAFMSSPTELESINARLAQIESDFPGSSDISSIARCTVRSNRGINSREFVHSTPKCDANFAPGGNTNGILQEIDTFLNKKPQEYFVPPWEREQRAPLGAATRLSDWARHAPGEKEPLISLSEIWSKEDSGQQNNIVEETLRRKHCERAIQALQTKLLEYQQKIAVAIEVDKKKDGIIQKHQEENSSLKAQLHRLVSEVHSIEARQHGRIKELQDENAALASEKERLQKDVTTLRGFINDLEEKNGFLEVKLTQLIRASDETSDVYKKQIADLEVRITNGHHTRGQLEEQLSSVKSELVALKSNESKAKKDKETTAKELELRQEEIKLLQQQKRDALDRYRDEKCRADTLINEKRMLEQNLQDLKEKELNVLKELESQRISLKSYYQQQLEQVISKKLAEFQTQLDSTEENLRMDGKEREKLLAERAIKQIEMINAKNEQEITLIQQKNNEEVALYRIQLSNATKTIEELQEKLDGYRSKRADIASKLHNIMESQWQKALEVLTSPNTQEKCNAISVANINPDMVDGVELSTSSKRDNPENESFETPTSSRDRKLRDRRKEEQLQAYIQLLLSKSPRDLDNLEELFRLSKSSDGAISQKNDTSANKSRRDQKPPWK